LRENLVDPDHWAHGLRYLAEGSSIALLLGFLTAWWFATGTVASADGEKLSPMPVASFPPDRLTAQTVPLRSALS